MSTKPTLRTRDIAHILGVSNHLIYKIIRENGLDVISGRGHNLLPPKTVKSLLEFRGFNFKRDIKPKVINIFGMKGGIGKTSLATAISSGLSRLGFSVLAIDIDMQGNLTQSFNKKSPYTKVMYDILSENCSLKEAIIGIHENLDLLPSSLSNSAIELLLSSRPVDTPHMFATLIEPIYSKYDVVVIDCPPSVNRITSCATMFSDLNIIPVNADMDSFDGVAMSVSEIKRLEDTYRKSRSAEIKYKILFNKYDAREKLSLTIMGKISQSDLLSENLMPTVIRTDTSFKNTKAEFSSIFDLSKSPAREDCLSLIADVSGIADWVLEKTMLEINTTDIS